MAETDIDLSVPEFTPIRGELARAFLKHRASMGLGDASSMCGGGSWLIN
jgi:hypothetical protein